jgi:hypothetical protein
VPLVQETPAEVAPDEARTAGHADVHSTDGNCAERPDRERPGEKVRDSAAVYENTNTTSGATAVLHWFFPAARSGAYFSCSYFG